jgi:hypothetical protein
MATETQKKFKPPYYPIIYVRGYAMTDNEIEETVADPYMGFNVGSTKLRSNWRGESVKYHFESPIVRLMKEHEYSDVYVDGADLGTEAEPVARKIHPRSIIIHRYYDAASTSFGVGDQVRIEEFARGLDALIARIRACLDLTDEERAQCKVNLVAHSMGGLVVRCFLQNTAVGRAENRAMVDKVFTYATPHNGIEFEMVGNVPGFLGMNSINNFSRERMRDYLKITTEGERVDGLEGKFDPDRFFCLIGTNSRDYTAAKGQGNRIWLRRRLNC